MSEEKAQMPADGKLYSWNSGSVDIASFYEKQMQLIEGLTEPTQRLIKAAGIREGFQVLDLAAGTGVQSIAAAGAAGSTGTVLATDVAPDMLKKVMLFAERENLTNISTQVMNAEQLTLADQTFDAVITRFGLNFFDYQKAISESYRVLKPKRKMAGLIWSTSERHLLSSIPITIIQKYVTLPSFPDEVARPGVFEQAIKQAGFSEVSVQAMPVHLQLPSIDTFFMLFIYPPAQASGVLGKLSPEDQQRVHGEIRQAMQQFEKPDGKLVLPSEVLLGVGTREE